MKNRRETDRRKANVSRKRPRSEDLREGTRTYTERRKVERRKGRQHAS